MRIDWSFVHLWLSENGWSEMLTNKAALFMIVPGSRNDEVVQQRLVRDWRLAFEKLANSGPVFRHRGNGLLPIEPLRERSNPHSGSHAVAGPWRVQEAGPGSSAGHPDKLPGSEAGRQLGGLPASPSRGTFTAASDWFAEPSAGAKPHARHRASRVAKAILKEDDPENDVAGLAKERTQPFRRDLRFVSYFWILL
ncbi:hypothetical protein [Bradyrhizobium sp. Gha]|uniref:hypothetical protein n=1 Tax=Bradyrhizobium sp. Gha TaxID=1855318 RepID=UPI001160A2E3|nr:hypothetical protein [Bradyrhizobium sp. Gha]